MRMATLHDASGLGANVGEYTCSVCKSKACEVMDAGR